MKILYSIILFITFTASAHAWSVIFAANEKTKKQWELVDPTHRYNIEMELYKHTSGVIKLQKIYTLNKDSKQGKKGDRLAMFLQEDSVNNHLSCVVLVNIESQQMQVLYKDNNKNKQANPLQTKQNETQ